MVTDTKAVQSFRPSIKLNVDLGSKLKSICKDTSKKRQPEHENMCSAPFLTISEKISCERPTRTVKDVFCGGFQKFNSAWILNKETIKCNKGKFIIESIVEPSSGQHQ